jgi:hypothetical protein
LSGPARIDGRSFAAAQAFILDAKVFWTTRIFPALRSEYEARTANAPSASASARDVAALVADGTLYRTFAWFERHLQRMKYAARGLHGLEADHPDVERAHAQVDNAAAAQGHGTAAPFHADDEADGLGAERDVAGEAHRRLRFGGAGNGERREGEQCEQELTHGQALLHFRMIVFRAPHRKRPFRRAPVSAEGLRSDVGRFEEGRLGCTTKRWWHERVPAPSDNSRGARAPHAAAATV